MLKLIRRGGNCVPSGTIAGPMVTLDMGDMYLKDVTLIGCTPWDEPVFHNLVDYVEHGEIRPLVAKVFALETSPTHSVNSWRKSTSATLCWCRLRLRSDRKCVSVVCAGLRSHQARLDKPSTSSQQSRA